MRNSILNSILKTTSLPAAAAAALLLAGCGESGSTAEETTVNTLEPDTMYEGGNDITAIDGAEGNMGETVGNGLENALDNAAEATENASQAIDNAQEAAN